MKTLIVTGGAGFIGSAVVRLLVAAGEYRIVTVDKLTYAGNRESLDGALGSPLHSFVQADIADSDAMRRVFAENSPSGILHLAAESHVDRSIDGPGQFIQTNVVGTFTLLQESLRFWRELSPSMRDEFRFLHVSTDEVFGSLGPTGQFTETTPYSPRSPYSASKAASDHLVRAWCHTYGLPTLITNCSNNYGPYQFPEKLIPVVIQRGLKGTSIPVYGRGENIRDWLFVDDHVRALLAVLAMGRVGETYNIGGHAERQNIQLVLAICGLLDELVPHPTIPDRASLITFVEDRPGHDLRYAIDASKLERETGWRAQESIESGLRKTVAWYLENQSWCDRVQSGTYRGERLGLGAAR